MVAQGALPGSESRGERLKIRKHVVNTALGRTPLRAVTAAMIETRLRALETDGLGMASLNGVRSSLHTIYSRARKAGLWTGANPIADVERRRVPKRAYATLRAEEVPILLAHVPPEWLGIFAAALYTGMRKGELFGLRKSDVDLRSGLLIVARSYDHDSTKGGHADAIPIAPPLVPFLETALESRGELVFPTGAGEMRLPEADPQKVLRHALARAGIVEGYEHVCRRCKAAGKAGHTARHSDAALRRCEACGMKLWPKALPRPMRFHDLRHTTATLLLRAGVDAHRVQRILRHSDVRTTTGTYGHLDVEDLRCAMGLLAPSIGLRKDAPSVCRERVVDGDDVSARARLIERLSQ